MDQFQYTLIENQLTGKLDIISSVRKLNKENLISKEDINQVATDLLRQRRKQNLKDSVYLNAIMEVISNILKTGKPHAL